MFTPRGGGLERAWLVRGGVGGGSAKGLGFVFDTGSKRVDVLEPLFVAYVEALTEDAEILEGRPGDLQRAGAEIGESFFGFPDRDANVGDFQHAGTCLERSWLSREAL